MIDMKYKIIDNFLSETCFNFLSSLKLKKISDDEIFGHHNQIYKGGNTKVTCLSKENLIELQKDCHTKTMNLLKELCPQKAELYEYSDFNIIETGKNYSFPIHRDHINKLLSGAVYLNPDINTGTIIYEDKKGKNPIEIPWKKNRAFFFSRTEKNTWHSYKGDGKNNRIVLVYNLMTTDTKAVCDIEGINHNIIKFREFINPYIYRFFKKNF